MSINAVIFDMDGVLIDSEPIYFRQLIHFFESLGIECAKNEGAVYLGLNTKATAQKIKEFHPLLNVPVNEIEERLSNSHNTCLQAFSDELSLIDGVLSYLQAFKHAGLKVAVASSSRYDTVHFVVNHFGLAPYLDAITTGSEIKESKPAPEIYLLAASRIGVSPCECLAIEDSANGIRAAKAASMQCWGFCGTNHFNTDFTQADCIFSHYDQQTLQKILAL